MAGDTFKDIEIKEVDQEETLKHKGPESLYWVHLKLSARPPPVWVKIFDGERSFARHSMWREAKVSGQYIAVHCPIPEIERYHKRDLLEDVKNTNQKYREFAEKERARQEAQKAAAATDKGKALDELGKIKF